MGTDFQDVMADHHEWATEELGCGLKAWFRGEEADVWDDATGESVEEGRTTDIYVARPGRAPEGKKTWSELPEAPEPEGDRLDEVLVGHTEKDAIAYCVERIEGESSDVCVRITLGDPQGEGRSF